MPVRSPKDTYRDELAATLLTAYAQLQPYKQGQKTGSVLTRFTQAERAKIYVAARLEGHDSTQDFIRRVVLAAVEAALPPVTAETADNLFPESA